VIESALVHNPRARIEALVAMIQVQLAVEPRLHVVADGHDANGATGRAQALSRRRRELPSPPVVGIERKLSSSAFARTT